MATSTKVATVICAIVLLPCLVKGNLVKSFPLNNIGDRIRINCGGEGNKKVAADQTGWVKSDSYTRSVAADEISARRAQGLVRDARFAKRGSLKYVLPAGSGTFRVRLMLVPYSDTKSEMQITVNGEVKNLSPHSKRFNSLAFDKVSGPSITVVVRNKKGASFVNGIVVVRTGASPRSTPVPTPKPTIKPPQPEPEPRPKPGPKSVTFPVWKGKPSGASQDFGRAPKAGVHPRVWFGPDRLPELRRLLLDTPQSCDDDLCHKPNAEVAGAAGFLYMKMRILTGRYNEPMMDGKSRFSNLFDRLKKGDTSSGALNDLKKLGGSIGHEQAAKGGAGYWGMYGLLAGANFAGLIKEEEQFNRKELATALASMCILHNKFYKQDNGDKFHHDAQVDLGLAYDFAASYMSESQKKPCRELIMKMIRGRKEIGQEGYLGAPWRTNWNHQGWHEHIVVLALSVYGEPGTDGEPERFMKECLEVQTKWFDYGISEGGYGREEIYYFNLGLMWAQPAQLAIARYGDKYNLVQKSWLGNERIYRQMLYHFYTKMIPGSTFTSFSGGNDPPRAQTMWQYLFPNDPIAHFNFQNAYWNDLWGDNALQMATFAVEPMKTLSMKEVAEAKNLPLSWMCRDRGRMIAKSSWDDDALSVDFEMRLDTYRSGHIASQPNSFYLYALGQAWIVKNDLYGDSYESSSMILIDGKGCSGVENGAKWMMPGMWNDYKHSETGITMGSADAAVSYTYESTCLGGTKCTDNPGFKSKSFGLKTDMFYQDWMEEDVGYKLLTLRNPMAYAHRTVQLVRGKTPFVLVTDDYKKDDDDTHSFTWYVNVPNGAYQTYLSDSVIEESSKRNEIVLRRQGPGGDGNGAPRLLMRLVDWDGSIDKDLAFVKANVKSVRTGSSKSLSRIMITTSSKVGRFRFFFCPFREGEKIPTTSFDKSKETLSVGLSAGTRRFKYVAGKDGRTIVSEL